jgi:hypothetical protein
MVSGEVSGDISDGVSGDVSDEFLFCFWSKLFCYIHFTVLLL